MDQLTLQCIDWNAVTSYNRVELYFTGLEENLVSLAATIAEKIYEGSKHWTERFFKNEKKVVLQEMADSQTNPEEAFYQWLTVYAYDVFEPIGRKNDLRRFHFKDALALLEDTFRAPTNVTLICRPQSKTDELLGALTPTVPAKEYSARDPKWFGCYSAMEGMPPKPPAQGTCLYVMTRFAFDRKSYSTYYEILMELLLGNLTAPLYKELRGRRGLVYGIAPSLVPGSTCAHSVLSLNTSPDKIEVLEKAVREFFKDISKYLAVDAFNRAKICCGTRYYIDSVMQFKNYRKVVIGTQTKDIQKDPRQTFAHCDYQDFLRFVDQYFTLPHLSFMSN